MLGFGVKVAEGGGWYSIRSDQRQETRRRRQRRRSRYHASDKSDSEDEDGNKENVENREGGRKDAENAENPKDDRKDAENGNSNALEGSQTLKRLRRSRPLTFVVFVTLDRIVIIDIDALERQNCPFVAELSGLIENGARTKVTERHWRILLYRISFENIACEEFE